LKETAVTTHKLLWHGQLIDDGSANNTAYTMLTGILFLQNGV